MKTTSLSIFLLLIVAFCYGQTKHPVELSKVLEKHGGIATWQSMKAMQYDIIRKKGNETHYIHLWDRRDRVEANTYNLGFDGQQVWVQEKGEAYKGNAIFYHNLMFYFYAMPFVLADDGIIYKTATPLEFEGTTYPGIHIAYQSEVGFSPEDEYFLHYDPDTYQMAWLGYTVTYYTKEKSKKIKWIRYDDWQEINHFCQKTRLSRVIDIKTIFSILNWLITDVKSRNSTRPFIKP